MNLLERIVNDLKKLKGTWITPSDEPKQGFVQLRTADGKTTITISITESKDAYKAKQLVSLALGDVESDESPYHLGMADMGSDEIE